MKSPLRDEHAWLDDLTLEEFEEYERRHKWLHDEARPEQVTPEGDWKTWLLLAGRGFGKTRTAAEDVAAYGLDNPRSYIGVVAETFADGRDVCIEGESGLLSCLPRSQVVNWNRSIGELVLKNGSTYRLFSGDKPDNLRGYNFHRLWYDELAKYQYPGEAWTQGQLGLRAGDDPRNIVTTTPRPIEIIKDLLERDNVVITSGSTYDNAANLPASFLDEVRRQYEGTKLGEQELFGQVVYLDDESAFKRDWYQGQNRYSVIEAPYLWNASIGRYIAIDTANTAKETSAYSAMVVGDIRKSWQMDIRHVARARLEFPDLLEWTLDNLKQWTYDFKLNRVYIEYAASGMGLYQTLVRENPAWLWKNGEFIVKAVKPMTGTATLPGKERGWRTASVWMKRGMVNLPDVTNEFDWLLDFEEEIFAVPNTKWKDQADALSMLINQAERSRHVFSTRWHTLNARAKAS